MHAHLIFEFDSNICILVFQFNACKVSDRWKGPYLDEDKKHMVLTND